MSAPSSLKWYPYITEHLFAKQDNFIHKVARAMVPVPIRCRIPEHLKRIGQNQQWLADKSGMSKQQLSDYIHMRKNVVIGLGKAKQIAELLKCSLDELYEWVWREE